MRICTVADMTRCEACGACPSCGHHDRHALDCPERTPMALKQYPVLILASQLVSAMVGIVSWGALIGVLSLWAWLHLPGGIAP